MVCVVVLLEVVGAVVGVVGVVVGELVTTVGAEAVGAAVVGEAVRELLGDMVGLSPYHSIVLSSPHPLAHISPCSLFVKGRR